MPGQADTPPVQVWANTAYETVARAPGSKCRILRSSRARTSAGSRLPAIGPQGAPHPAHDHRGREAGAGDIADHHAQLARGQGEHVIPVAAQHAAARDVAGRHLSPGSSRERRRQQAALQRHRRDPLVPHHQRLHRRGRPVRGQLQKLDVVAGELPGGQGADTSTPITLPPAISGTPIRARIPFAIRIGFSTVE